LTSSDIAAVDEQIEAHLAPFAAAAARLDEIPGIGVIAAAAINAEIAWTCPDSAPPAPVFLGQILTRAQQLGRQNQWQRIHRTWQPLSRPHTR
jgi:transposase